MAPKVWFITGASSGFGRSMTERVLGNGDNCIATSTDPPALADLLAKYGNERLRLLELDVTRPDEITVVFGLAQDAFGHIDVVFNNAGTAIGGEMEGVSEESARKLFDVNFWGAANVTKEAIRFFRDVNGAQIGGKLLQVSSVAGIRGVPNLAYYSASKHALEGLTTALIAELMPEWNIQVMLIEPGFFRTSILQPQIDVDTHPAYIGGGAERVREHLRTSHEIGNPERAIELIHRVAQMDRIPLYLPVGVESIRTFRRQSEAIKEAAEKWEESTQELTRMD